MKSKYELFSQNWQMREGQERESWGKEKGCFDRYCWLEKENEEENKTKKGRQGKARRGRLCGPLLVFPKCAFNELSNCLLPHPPLPSLLQDLLALPPCRLFPSRQGILQYEVNYSSGPNIFETPHIKNWQILDLLK